MALSARLPAVKRRCAGDVGFGGQPVAQELRALAYVLGEGVTAFDSFVGQQSAAGHQVHDIGVPVLAVRAPAVGAHGGRP